MNRRSPAVTRVARHKCGGVEDKSRCIKMQKRPPGKARKGCLTGATLTSKSISMSELMLDMPGAPMLAEPNATIECATHPEPLD